MLCGVMWCVGVWVCVLYYTLSCDGQYYPAENNVSELELPLGYPASPG